MDGLKITIDLKRGVEPEKLMQRLFKMTSLEDTFSCNFNVLVAGVPRVMGVGELLDEWTSFRIECIRRRTYFDLTKKKEKLHLLKGLQAILLDIDKAITIVRGTDEETEVVPNLMIGFGIDEVQAEFVAEIKLRHLNREYILKRTEEISQLEKEIAELQSILDSRTKVKNIIITELSEVAKNMVSRVVPCSFIPMKLKNIRRMRKYRIIRFICSLPATDTLRRLPRFPYA